MPENSFLNDQYWVIISNLYSWLAVNTKSLLKSPLTFLLGILESTHHCRFDTLMKMMTPKKKKGEPDSPDLPGQYYSNLSCYMI